ncbi:Xanthomonalisin [Chromobacterium violaceum]
MRSAVSLAGRNRVTLDWTVQTGGALKQPQFYVAPSMSNTDIAAAIHAAVAANSAKVINASQGEGELGTLYSGMTCSVDQMLQTSIAHGQTSSTPTGDSGSNE